MALGSNKYCSACNEMVCVAEEHFVGGIRWRCLECDHIIDVMWDEEDIDE